MKAYSVASRKGGVGKSSFNMWLTTLAFHLLYKQNIRICLIDMDDQSTASNAREKELANNKRLKSLSNFYPDDYKERLQNLYPVYSWTFEDYEKKFKKLKENFDIVFIDFAGRMQKEQLPVLQTIDKVIVPILADEKDIESGASFMHACHKLDIPTAWFLNRYSGTKFNEFIYNNGHKKFLQINPDIEQLKWTGSKDENLNKTPIRVQQAPELFRANSSTILPFDDQSKTIKSMLEYFLK